MLTSPTRALRALGVAAALAVALPATPVTAAPAVASPATAVGAGVLVASAGDSGLYGSASPTYDGVYRQSWAILGLRSVGASVPTKAVRWLTGQQCANGGFQSYRASTSTACSASSASAFSGPDSNSTALAAMALRSVGQSTRANRAIAYLKTMQNADGGFTYYKGGDSDANSTGLALAALRGGPATSATKKQISRANGWLRSVQRRCSVSTGRGLVPYQAGGPANYLASAQAAIGMVTTLPATPRSTSPKALRCSGTSAVGSVSTRNALLWGSAQALKAGGGSLANQFGSGKDLSATSGVVIALGASRQYSSVVSSAVKVLKANAAAYTNSSGAADPAALGTLLVVADVTPKTAPRSFGGVNLVAELRGTLR